MAMTDHSTALNWLATELDYADQKREETIGRDHDDADMKALGLDGIFAQDIRQYLHRAIVLGVENPNGRQALGKMVAVGVAAMESAVRCFGDMPEAGRASGDG